MSGQLCLKWNNHTTAFNKLLGRIYLEDIYSDGTILCQGKFYPVHRFVLSTCSEYFEEMFSQCVRLNNKHPFIIVKDIHPEQMEALLNYMYKGEVNVPQEMLPELIKAAEAFKIKGLAVPDEEPSKPSRKRSSACSPPSIPKRSRKQEDKSSFNKSDNLGSDNRSYSNINENDQLNDKSSPSTSKAKSEEIYISEPLIPQIKAEPIDSVEPSPGDNTVGDNLMKHEQNVQDNYEDYSGGDDSNFENFDFDPSDENFDAGQSGSWDNSQAFEGGEEGNEDDPSQRILHHLSSKRLQKESDYVRYEECFKSSAVKKCSFSGCSFTTIHPGNLKTHYRVHTGEKPFNCPQCGKGFSQKKSVDAHVKSVHCNEKPFHCSLCPYKTALKHNLKIHLIGQHNANN